MQRDHVSRIDFLECLDRISNVFLWVGREMKAPDAARLAPAYVRVSGTWANTTYFAVSDSPPSAPPPGFNGILSHQQWRGVIDFSQAVGAQIVTSFAVSPGTRDATGVWTPNQARRFLAYTRSIGGTIAVAEFMNEPNLAEMGGAPAGYDAAG